MTRVYQTYGPIVALAANDRRAVLAFGPRYNQQLLTDPQLFHNSSLDFNSVGLTAPRDSAWYRTSTGLLTMNGARHKQQRRLMQPAFHRKQVDGYRDEMVTLIQRMLDGWQAKAGRADVFDIAHELRQLTLMIASQTLFGVDATADADSIGYKMERWIKANAAPSITLLPYNLPGTGYRRVLQVSEQLEAEIKAIIEHKRAHSDEHRDVLSTLISVRDEDGTALTDAELIGQAAILFIAGHETSANALTWALFLLAQHPHIASDLLDELDSVLHGDAPSVEQLGRLPLLERVVKESMRLLPPVSASQRLSTAPFKLGPYELPKHAAVTYSPYITHRIPELYEDPQRFMPQRWETIDPSPYEYLPFGAGPRMCIGWSFAMMELKLTLAMLHQRFRMALLPGTRVDRQVTITLQPKGGLPMRIVPQDRALTKVTVRGNIHEMVELD
jgi:cytochrome P450